MTIDDKLRAHIEAMLREYTSQAKREKPDFESRIACHAGKLAHLAIIAMCVELDPPPRSSRKVGQRGPSRASRFHRYIITAPAPDHCAHVVDYCKRQPFSQAHQRFMDALCSAYVDLTGKTPTRSTNRGKFFREFVADMHEATQMEICLDYVVQIACERYSQR